MAGQANLARLETACNLDLAELAKGARTGREVVRGLVSVQTALAPLASARERLQRCQDAVPAAAEAGDFELASKLFKRQMYEQWLFQRLASELADVAISAAMPLPPGDERAALGEGSPMPSVMFA
jgi:hypothetical protein